MQQRQLTRAQAAIVEQFVPIADEVGRSMWWRWRRRWPWLEPEDWRQEARVALARVIARGGLSGESPPSHVAYATRCRLFTDVVRHLQWEKRRGESWQLSVADEREHGARSRELEALEAAIDVGRLLRLASPLERRVLEAELAEVFSGSGRVRAGAVTRAMTPSERYARARFVQRARRVCGVGTKS